jgi:phage recombination protein Bet
MNAVTAINNNGSSALTTAEYNEAIRTALKSSLYPGASDASVDLVLSYCKAAGLDPMKKPVHIVPMWDSKAKEMRDVVMPGIGLYRTDAARTGQFAGMSEPEFGPMITERLGNRDVTFPEWCKVTAYRQLPSGHVAEFTAVEFWIENYAVKGGKDQDQSPNAMWSKRVRGQLAKCAQAQALRMAFPEATGAGPTAEEMEGKSIIEGDATVVTKREDRRVDLPFYSEADFANNLPKWWEVIDSGKKTADELIAMLQTKARFTAEQLEEIRTPPEEEDEGSGEDQA